MASFLIVGLGNPGEKYENTRHNLGFEVIDKLSEAYGATHFQKKFQGLLAKATVGDHTVYLLKPQTYMNLSGTSVRQAIDYFKIEWQTHFFLLHDDLDTEMGGLRVRKQGGSGGNNGVASVIEHLGSKAFLRARLGIGRPVGGPTDAYVLGRWTKNQQKDFVDPLVEKAQKAVDSFITHGIDKTMNAFNQK